jgi:hypothetical protein
VRVDEPRQQEHVAQVVVVAGRRFFRRTDERDAIAVYGDDTVAHRLGGDGHDPARAISDHAGKI